MKTQAKRTHSWGIALLRVIVGITFAAHGAQKLFVFGLDGVTGAFTQMGIPAAAVAAPLVAFLELFGGLALVTGLLTRIAALPLAFTMLVAMVVVHAPAGFFAPQGVELTLLLAAASGTLAIAGPGALALDNLLSRRITPAAENRLLRLALGSA